MTTAPAAGPGNLATYKRLLRYTLRWWRPLLVSMFGYMLFSAMEASAAKLAGFMVEQINARAPDMAVIIPLAILAISLGRGVGSFLGETGISYAARNLVNALRCEMYGRMLRLPTRHYAESNTGQMVSKLTYNVGQVTAAATDATKTLFQNGFTVIGLLGYMFWMNWKLTLILIAFLPFVGLLVRAATRRFQKLSRKMQASTGQVTHVASETLGAMQVVKLFGGTEHEQKRFEQASTLNMRQGLKMQITKSFNTPAVQTVLAFPLAIIVWIALHPDVMGNMSAGDFISYIAAMGIMIKPVKALTDVNHKVQLGVIAAASVFEVIDSEAEDVGGTHAPERVRGEIEFRDVRFRYPGKDVDVLRGVSFHVQPGQTVALVGRSGGGKTTLSNLLPRFYDITGGDILVDGVPLREYELTALRRQISLVPQKVTLFDDTVAANIAYGEQAGASAQAIAEAAEAAHAAGFIAELPQGYATRVGQDGAQLSGGQRQRVAIARALLRNTPILILDEATSALDNESEAHIQHALERLMQGRTTFVIAHRLTTIERADLILVVSEGRIVEQGSHGELLARGGHYARMHQRNFSDDPADGPVEGGEA